MGASFQQTSFLGGEWSPTAQGRMTDANYQRALDTCSNGMPIEAGSWARRPGLRYLGMTRHGTPAKLFAFDFSTTQPYQIELTDGFLRLWAGTTLVMDDDPDGYIILNVTTDNPAKVAVASMPATWANGDTVFFFINSEPCSAPGLCNRQFTIQDVSTTTNTFTLRDPVTGANIDGSTIAWMAPLPGGKQDFVAKVFELATPYTGITWQDVRVTHNDTQVTLFHPSYAPRTLSTSVAEPFALTTQAFSDGPYLDPNTTTTTLTPSAASGSITITASATTGINNGVGFESTDVGRAIRFQSAPAAWDGGTLYAKGETVTASDGNIYSAIISSLAVDPTADDGTHWLLVGATPTWVWLLITAVADSTHVTATVEGAATNPLQSPFILPNTLPSLTAQTAWQLGFYSNTTGWPSIGVYHQGRLWLANTSQANRFDGSVANDYFNFCPTAADGTVSDGNAIAAVLNADEVNAVFWMQSLPSGLTIGTQGSEWNIAASQLNDPITPTSIQVYRMSNFGSADIEAIKPWNRVLFVQRHNRKLLALRQAGEQGFDADNVSHLAAQITAPGIAEIRWQQEPVLTTWIRRLDGTLAGCVYRSSAYSWSYGQSQAITDSNFAGFFTVTHAYARSFESISTGPSYDGLSSALYAVTNQTDNTKPDYNVRHVEYLMPLFDDSVQDWGAFFVDGGASPCCARKFLISNGDSFDGVRLYGLTYLNGLSTSVIIGGLDIGDFAVSNGYVDVPFGTPAAFTETFFNALDNGTDYGVFQTDVSYVTATGTTSAPHPAGSIGSYVNATETHGNFAFSDLDLSRNKVYGFNTQDGNLDIFNYTTFALTSTVTETALLDGHTFIAADFCAHPQDGFLYFAVDGGNHCPFGKFDPDQNFSPVIHGSSSSSLAASGSDPSDGYALRGTRQILPLTAGLFGYVAHVGTTSISSAQEVCLFNTTDMKFANGSVLTIAESYATLCIGPYSEDDNFASFYILGRENSINYSSGTTVGLYRCSFAGGGLDDGTTVRESWFGHYTPQFKLAPADIDPTWTTFGQVRSPVVCGDGGLIMSATCTDVVTNTSYLFKINPDTKEIIWKVAGLDFGDPSPISRKTPCFEAIGHLTDSGGTPTFHYVRVDTGAVTNFAFNSILDQIGVDFFDEIDGGLVMFDPEWAWSVNPTFLGTWSQAHGSAGNSSKLSKLYFGLAATGAGGPAPYTSRQYKVPSSTGLAYTSKGKLLRPDFGPDAGARNGPAFGKKRRLHWYAASLYRTQGISFGTDFAVMEPAQLLLSNASPVVAPMLYSGIISTTLNNDYSFEGQMCWEITRPYPAMIVALGGYVELADK